MKPVSWDVIQDKIRAEMAFFADQNDLIESLEGNHRAAEHMKLWAGEPCWDNTEYGIQYNLQRYWERQCQEELAEKEDT